jgi:hypothetical protein
VVKHADDYRRNGGDMNEEIVQFLKRHFAAGRK